MVIAGIVSLEFNSPTESAFEEILLFLAADTEYASGFSHEAFSQVKAGDSEAHVYDLLNRPLQTDLYEDGSKYLIYSASTDGTTHRRRDILIKDETVKKVFAEMYWD